MARGAHVDGTGFRAQKNSVVRESAPHIGSGSSSSAEEEGFGDEAMELDLDAESEEEKQCAALQEQLRRCDEELASLRSAYDLEVQTCADLREQLEAHETNLSEANAPIKEELASAKAALAEVESVECGAIMHIEDDLARNDRLLDARNREIKFLERRLHTLQQNHEQLLNDQDVPDSAAEQALRAADKEVSTLQTEVQHRETQIALVTKDLKGILDFVIRTNIEAAGGPAPFLSSEDFLPSGVREHLNLSSHSSSHLSILFRKYELQMQELRELQGNLRPPNAGFQEAIPDPAMRNGSRGSDSSILETAAAIAEQASSGRLAAENHSGQSGNAGEAKHKVNAPEASSGYEWGHEDAAVAEPAVNLRPALVAAGLEDEDAIADLQWQESALDESDFSPTSGNADSPQPYHGAFGNLGSPSANAREESELLMMGLKQEVQQLSEVLSSSASEEQVPLHKLLQAARIGNERSVKELLPLVGDACLEEALLGWTAWHVAAGAGQVRVLECLKEEAVQRSAHYLLTLSQPTGMGLPPLGVACLRGQVEAVRSLLLGMAPIDSRDARGNTPLFWAIAGGQAEELVPLLLAAHADPSIRNKSGQLPNVTSFLQGTSTAASGAALSSSGRSFGTGNLEHTAGSVARGAAREAAPEMQVSEPFHLIYALGAQPASEKDKGLLSYTIGMLKAPARDAIGFARNAIGRELARFNSAETEAGVYSCYVTNFTHAGLQSALEGGRPAADPVFSERNQQALVLTCERLLLFHYTPVWALVQVIALSEIQQLIICSHSATILVLRMHRVPDVVLDVSHRSRVLDEIQLAARRVAARWGGSDMSNMVLMQSEEEPIIALMDEHRRRAGSLAFVETDVFLLLPFVPGSLLISGSHGDTFFFGFLDFHQSIGAAWKWQSFLFILKSGPSQVRQLHWCRYPNDAKSAGSIPVDKICGVHPLDTPQEQSGACFILDYEGQAGKAEALTLRARTARCREDWITSIRAMETWM